MSRKNKGTFGNKRKDDRLKSISLISDSSSLKDTTDNLTIRCKFNFSYFDFTQGTTFFNLNRKQQEDLINAIIAFSKNSLSFWETQGSKEKHTQKFVIYGTFPSKEKTKFTQPRYIPNDVCWCRFRLLGKFRLIGFIVPEYLHNTNYNEQNIYFFDKNTFYVVFIDPYHQFWLTSEK